MRCKKHPRQAQNCNIFFELKSPLSKSLLVIPSVVEGARRAILRQRRQISLTPLETTPNRAATDTP